MPKDTGHTDTAQLNLTLVSPHDGEASKTGLYYATQFDDVAAALDGDVPVISPASNGGEVIVRN